MDIRVQSFMFERAAAAVAANLAASSLTCQGAGHLAPNLASLGWRGGAGAKGNPPAGAIYP